MPGESLWRLKAARYSSMAACALGQRRRRRSELLGLHLEAPTLKTTSRSNCSALALIPRLGYLSVAAKCLTADVFFPFHDQSYKEVTTTASSLWPMGFRAAPADCPPF